MSINHRIYDLLNKEVHGHAKAKKILINLINRSRTYYYEKHVLNLPIEKKSNVTLLIGRSGTGKTQLVKSLSRIMQFPIMFYDATEIQPISAQGGINVEDIRKDIDKFSKSLMSSPGKYYSEAGARAQIIVFIDEIDKLGKGCEGTSNNWNNKTQATLLSLLEDVELDVSFILAGAFSEADYGKSKETSKPIGFTHSGYINRSSDKEIDTMVLNYGLMAEIVGRITHIAQLDTFSKEDYHTVLHNHILPSKISELEKLGIEHIFEDKQLTDIIERAFKSDQGIRHIKRSLDDLLIDIEFESDPSYILETQLLLDEKV